MDETDLIQEDLTIIFMQSKCLIAFNTSDCTRHHRKNSFPSTDKMNSIHSFQYPKHTYSIIKKNITLEYRKQYIVKNGKINESIYKQWILLKEFNMPTLTCEMLMYSVWENMIYAFIYIRTILGKFEKNIL